MLNKLKKALYLVSTMETRGTEIHLEAIKFQIPFYSMEEQACYAEPECKYNNRNRHYLDIQFKDFNPYDSEQFRNWSTRSVGNMAYLAIHCPFTDICVQCEAALVSYQLYLLDQGITPNF